MIDLPPTVNRLYMCLLNIKIHRRVSSKKQEGNSMHI